MIVVDIKLAGSLSKGSCSNAVHDFRLIKHFSVTCHAPKAPVIKQVHWHPPIVGWTKCNSDGSARGNPGAVAAGEIFRNSQGFMLGCFSAFLGNRKPLYVEFSAAIMAIEFAHQRGWHSLWLEYDSKLVVDVFSSNVGVPWQLVSRWKNCKSLCLRMEFRISHFYGRVIIVLIN